MDLLDELFADVRADLNKQANEVDALAARATKAVEAWRAAKRSVLQHELAARLGVTRPIPANAHDAALAILAACEQIPECAQAMGALRTEPNEEPVPTLAPVRSLAEAAQVLSDAAPVDVPRLAAASAPMAIIGGSPSQEKLAWARKSVPRIEWLEMPATSNSQGVIDKIRNKRFSSVLVLSGMLHTHHAERVRAAASAACVPYASAPAAGQGQLREAMLTLDAKLRGAA